jgi:heme exporter protein C
MQVLANPRRFLSLANAVLPWCWAATAIAFAMGLYLALVASPPDYQQGETVRIMYVHVPAASLSLAIYVLMALASATAIIFRHPLADVAARAAAPIGATYCALALITGSLWGKPMWGTWWVWDARLTSMFVLLLLYLGYISVWQAIDDQRRAAAIARIVALVGVINVPIVKFSVEWWNSLHQPASILRAEGPAIDPSILWPLAVMALAYGLLFLSLHLTAIRNSVWSQKLKVEHLKGVSAR